MKTVIPVLPTVRGTNCANFVLKHSLKDQNRSNGLDEIEFSQRLVYLEKNGKPESKQGVQEYTLISLISRGSPVQSGAPPPRISTVYKQVVVSNRPPPDNRYQPR